MNCYIHLDRESIGTCTTCGRPICSECALEMQGKLVCRECISTGRATLRSQSAKDPNTAFIIELVGGFFGLLGLGYFYVGRTNDGLIRLISWIIYSVIAVITISLLLAVFIGLVCIPFQLVIQIGVPLWSATALKNQLLSQPVSAVPAIRPMISGPTTTPAARSQTTSQASPSEADSFSTEDTQANDEENTGNSLP